MTEEETPKEPEALGDIYIRVTDDEISYDSTMDIANICFFLDLTKALILKQSMEKQ